MKNNYPKIIYIFLTLISFLSLFPAVGRTSDVLEVSFSSNPLFSVSNFLPGDKISGTVVIKNNSNENQSIYIKAQNVSDVSGLGNVLTLTIKKEGNILYENFLSHFFNTSNVYLSDLSPGEQRQFVLEIAFDFSADNQYQKKNIQFDLIINSQGTGNGGGGGGGGGGGIVVPVIISSGGGGGVPVKLEIFNILVDNVGEDRVNISWQTNLPATSQIIYSAQNEPHAFDPSNPPKYGYFHIFPEPEDSNLVNLHSFWLLNLKNCTTYYFRVISREPLGTQSISQEYSFTTLCPVVVGESKKKKEFPISEIEIKIGGEEKKEEEVAGEEKEKPLAEKPSSWWDNFLASMAGLSKILEKISGICFNWWLLFLFVIYPLFRVADSLQKMRKEKNKILKEFFKKQTFGWSLGAFIPLILAFFAYYYSFFCIPWWIFFVLALATIFGWYFNEEILKRKIKKVEQRNVDFLKNFASSV